MNSLVEPKPSDRQSERSDASLGKLIDRSYQVLAESSARTARARALSRADADLARAIDQISKETGREKADAPCEE